MKLSEYAKQRDVLSAWAKPDAAGNARAQFLTAIGSCKADDPIFTVDFGRAFFTVAADGGEFTHAFIETADAEALDKAARNKPARFPVGVHIDTQVPSGAAPTNKMIGGLRIPSGVVLIVAGANAGKTPMAHALAGAQDSSYSVVRYGEPLAGYLADERLGAQSLAECMFHSSDVVLDSVKDVLALASGGAMKSGISRGALPLMSRWGALAASLGVTLYIPLNPSSSDNDVVELLVEAAKSNATMTIFSTGTDQWGYVSRRGEGLQRESGTFTTSYTGDGLMEISSVLPETRSGDASSYNVQTLSTDINLSDVELHNAIRRSIISQDN